MAYHSVIASLIEELSASASYEDQVRLKSLAGDCADLSNQILIDIAQIAAFADLSQVDNAGFRLANLTATLAEITDAATALNRADFLQQPSKEV